MAQVIHNIAETIGCKYEILFEENGITKNSITKVYNKLYTRASYEYLLFMHEDMKFLSKNWGETLISLMNEDNVGLVGLSGATYKSKYPAVWSASRETNYRISGNQYDREHFLKQKYKLHDVVVIDGCFLAAKKMIFSKYLFDENLHGFHGYDIDLSLNIGCDYRVLVAADIDFLHFSSGVQNLDWLVASLYVHKKWKNKLPRYIRNMSRIESLENDYLALQNVYWVFFLFKTSLYQIIYCYCLFITKYFKFNKFKYTKTTLQYIIFKHWSAKE